MEIQIQVWLDPEYREEVKPKASHIRLIKVSS